MHTTAVSMSTLVDKDLRDKRCTTCARLLLLQLQENICLAVARSNFEQALQGVLEYDKAVARHSSPVASVAFVCSTRRVHTV
jgi:hypothetical protein